MKTMLFVLALLGASWAMEEEVVCPSAPVKPDVGDRCEWIPILDKNNCIRKYECMPLPPAGCPPPPQYPSTSAECRWVAIRDAQDCIVSWECTPARSTHDDQHVHCCYWAQVGECRRNPLYMSQMCRAACLVSGCSDPHFFPFHGFHGSSVECQSNHRRNGCPYHAPLPAAPVNRLLGSPALPLPARLRPSLAGSIAVPVAAQSPLVARVETPLSLPAVLPSLPPPPQLSPRPPLFVGPPAPFAAAPFIHVAPPLPFAPQLLSASPVAPNGLPIAPAVITAPLPAISMSSLRPALGVPRATPVLRLPPAPPVLFPKPPTLNGGVELKQLGPQSSPMQTLVGPATITIRQAPPSLSYRPSKNPTASTTTIIHGIMPPIPPPPPPSPPPQPTQATEELSNVAFPKGIDDGLSPSFGGGRIKEVLKDRWPLKKGSKDYREPEVFADKMGLDGALVELPPQLIEAMATLEEEMHRRKIASGNPSLPALLGVKLPEDDQHGYPIRLPEELLSAIRKYKLALQRRRELRARRLATTTTTTPQPQGTTLAGTRPPLTFWLGARENPNPPARAYITVGLDGITARPIAAYRRIRDRRRRTTTPTPPVAVVRSHKSPSRLNARSPDQSSDSKADPASAHSEIKETTAHWTEGRAERRSFRQQPGRRRQLRRWTVQPRI